MIPLRLEDGLSDYAPFTDRLSDDLHTRLGLIANPAIKLLQHRAADTLPPLLESLTPLLNTAHSQASALFLTPQPTAKPINIADYQSDSYCLFAFRKELEPLRQSTSLEWTEIFALITLGYIGILHSRDQHPEISLESLEEQFLERIRKTTPDQKASLKREGASGRLSSYQQLLDLAPIFAVEALGFARALEVENTYIQAQKNRLTKVNRSRGEKFVPAKTWLSLEYQKLYDDWKTAGRKLTRRHAAKLLEKSAQQHGEILKPFTTDAPRETFEKWIKAYEEGTLTDMEGVPPFKP